MSADQTESEYSNKKMISNIRATTNEQKATYPTGFVGKAETPFTYPWWKNILDRVGAFILLIVLAPFMAVVSLIIKLDSPGSAIYKREQVGKDGQIFTAYKFRTMQTGNDDTAYKEYITRYVTDNAPYTRDANGRGIYKVVNDPRTTRFGSLLRKTNLDELPQLVNVIKGEMSFIGPRPDIPYAVSLYRPWHLKRLTVKPGITGLWQVSDRRELSFEGMVRLDLIYSRHQSLLLDARIFFMTIKTIIKGDGS